MANIAFIGVVQGASEGVDLILGLEERTPHSVTVAVTNYNTKASIATCLLLPHEHHHWFSLFYSLEASLCHQQLRNHHCQQ